MMCCHEKIGPIANEMAVRTNERIDANVVLSFYGTCLDRAESLTGHYEYFRLKKFHDRSKVPFFFWNEPVTYCGKLLS